jgi:predicted metal-dependent hydrolase
MPEVIIGGRPIPYRLVRNPRSRHVRMTLTPEGLRVSAPVRLPERDVQRALLSREQWLLRHSDLLLPSAPPALADGMSLPFLDGEVELGVRISSRPSVRFRPEDGRLSVDAPAPEAIRALVERGYRGVARDWFARACADHGARIGVLPHAITIRDPRTRWGSCSARGTVSFSWRLLMAPARVAEYVVVHELAHLVHLDHSPAFWACVDHARPDHRMESRWLRDHARWLSVAPTGEPRPPAP